MGFILVSLVVGGLLVLLGWGIGKLENAQIVKTIACVLSVFTLAIFVSALFTGVDKIQNTLVLVIALIVLIIFPMAFYPEENKGPKRFLIITACLIVLIGGIAGVWCGNGYQDDIQEVEVIELAECNFTHGENKYSFHLYEEANYYVYLKQNSATNQFEEIKISKNEARVEEDINCTEPRLVVYERKANQTFWSFGVAKKTEYVFYLPTNSVLEDIFP